MDEFDREAASPQWLWFAAVLVAMSVITLILTKFPVGTPGVVVSWDVGGRNDDPKIGPEYEPESGHAIPELERVEIGVSPSNLGWRTDAEPIGP